MVPRIWLSQVYHRRIFFNTSGRQCRVAWGGGGRGWGEGGGGEREGWGEGGGGEKFDILNLFF